jgi:UDP-N-acetyl-D-glucosamine dehydrogenase
MLLEKIKNKQALVGIIGMGYVGLPLVLRFCEVGFRFWALIRTPTK